MKIFDKKECVSCVHDRKSKACIFCGNTDGNRGSRAPDCKCNSCNETAGMLEWHEINLWNGLLKKE